MSRNLEASPTVFDSKSVLPWLESVHNSITLLENLIVTTITVATTLRPEHSGLILINNTAAITITLPKAAVVGEGLSYVFIKTSSNIFVPTIDGSGAETINGVATYVSLNSIYDTVSIVSNGSNWLIYAERLV